MADPVHVAADSLALHGMVACQQVGRRKESNPVPYAPSRSQQGLLADGIGGTMKAGGMESIGDLVPSPEPPHILPNPGKTRLCR